MTPLPRTAVRALCVAVAVLGISSCSSDASDAGAASARGVIDKHVELARDFQLEADCELRSPELIELMAMADNTETDDYCKRAVAQLVSTATPENKAESREIYTDPEVIQVTLGGDSGTFEVRSKHNGLVETIEVAKTDGRWYITSLTDNGAGLDDGHDH